MAMARRLLSFWEPKSVGIKASGQVEGCTSIDLLARGGVNRLWIYSPDSVVWLIESL